MLYTLKAQPAGRPPRADPAGRRSAAGGSRPWPHTYTYIYIYVYIHNIYTIYI